MKTYTAFAETKSLNAWAKDPRCARSKSSLYRLADNHDNFEHLLITKAHPQYSAFGTSKTLLAWSQDSRCPKNVTLDLLRSRVTQRKLTVEEAFSWRLGARKDLQLVEGFKRCVRCKRLLALTEFHKQADQFFGVRPSCKDCEREGRREQSRKQLYKMAPGEYENLLSEQNGVCAICANPETHVMLGILLPLAVDHCHKTGKVRGLLCKRCNRDLLGCVQDDPTILENAANYLRKAL